VTQRNSFPCFIAQDGHYIGVISKSKFRRVS